MKVTNTASKPHFRVSFLDKTPSSEIEEIGPIRIPVYTDGSYFPLSDEGCYGVYYPLENHPNALVPIYENNVSLSLAELLGVKHAMINIANELHGSKNGTSLDELYEIFTDSTYVICWVTRLYEDWRLHGSLDMLGQGGRHLRTIFDIVAIYNFINVKYHNAGHAFLRLTHVKAHVGNFGNFKADALARDAARS